MDIRALFSTYYGQIRNSTLSGMFLAALGGVLFTISNFCVQMATKVNEQTIPCLLLVLIRHLIQLLALAPIVVLKLSLIEVEKDNIFDVAVMGGSGFFSVLFLFLSLDRIPLADTTVIMFVSPFLTAIVAYAVLKEEMHFLDCVCGLLSFTGVVIVARPVFLFGNRKEKINLQLRTNNLTQSEQEIVYLLGIGFAVLAASLVSVYSVYNKKISFSSNILQSIFYPSVLGTLVSSVLLLPEVKSAFVRFNIYAIAYCIILGFTSTFGLLLMSLALQASNASSVISIRNLDVLSAITLQFLCMGLKPSIWTLAGGALIMISTTLIVLRRWMSGKNKPGHAEGVRISNPNNICVPTNNGFAQRSEEDFDARR